MGILKTKVLGIFFCKSIPLKKITIGIILVAVIFAIQKPDAHFNKQLFLRYLLIILTFFLLNSLQAQTASDSLNVPSQESNLNKPQIKKHSPKKATLLSLVIPGAGQIYNKKNWWWKVPIIYGAEAGLIYGGVFSLNEFNGFRDAYIQRQALGYNIDKNYNRYQSETLLSIRDSYRQDRDMFFVYAVVVYAIQVLDAAVEAHFVDFNMNENVSLKLQPQFFWVGNNITSGLQVTLKF